MNYHPEPLLESKMFKEATPEEKIKYLISGIDYLEKELSSVAEWAPIETAPRDGTVILAVVAGLDDVSGLPFWPTVVQWCEEYNCWMTCEDWVEDQHDIDGSWIPPIDWDLTHWKHVGELPLGLDSTKLQ